MKFPSLSDRVVVITGASSGIGRLAVEKFLLEGARVVMAARSEDDMKWHVKQLDIPKEQVLIVRTDVSDFAQVQQLAKKAVQHFGHIDVWVNNAGINIYGTVEQLDVNDIKRLVDVNLMGEIHGVKAVLPYFKKQKYGNIINMSSVFGKVAAPLQSAYNASKFGLVGFSKALREELAYRYPNIEVSLILPASMHTPMFAHAKNAGANAQPIPPVYDPMIAANAIVEAAKNPRPEIFVGGIGKALTMMDRLMPYGVERVMAVVGFANQMAGWLKSTSKTNNLYNPVSSRDKTPKVSEALARKTHKKSRGLYADRKTGASPLPLIIGTALPIYMIYRIITSNNKTQSNLPIGGTEKQTVPAA